MVGLGLGLVCVAGYGMDRTPQRGMSEIICRFPDIQAQPS